MNSNSDKTETCHTCISSVENEYDDLRTTESYYTDSEYESNGSNSYRYSKKNDESELIDNLMNDIDINNNKKRRCDFECENSDYMCSFCGAGIVYIDDSNMYEYDQLYLLYDSNVRKRLVKNAYAYEKEPKEWLIFCRRMCEIRFNCN